MDYLKAFGIEEGKNNPHQQIIHSIALIYNVIYDEMAAFFEPYDLTPGKFNILMAIKHHGGQKGIRQVEVSKQLILTPSNMTKMIDKLEKEGFVQRSALKGDRRVNIVKVTSQGVELLDSIWESYNAELKKAVGPLSKVKQKQLAALLTEWFEKLK